MKRLLFAKQDVREQMSPEVRAQDIARLKAYWEDVYGPRPHVDLSVLPEPEPAPATTCEFCCDLGVFKRDVPMDDPDFGKFFNCPYCDTGRERTRQLWVKRYRLSSLPIEFQGFTFDTWDRLIREKNAEQGKRAAYYAARQFVENARHDVDLFTVCADAGLQWDEDRSRRAKNSLVFHGPMGNGKSGLMASIFNCLLARGELCLYSRLDEFVDEYRATYDEDAEQRTYDVMTKHKTVPVLWWDEVNMFGIKPDMLNKIESVIRYRYNNGLPTLMTMNIDQGEFADMWAGRSADAAVAMAHWIYVGGHKLRETDGSVYESEPERYWER